MATTGSSHLTGSTRYKRVGIDAVPALGFLALVLIISWLYTNAREQQITERGKLRIAMVQPSIPQQVIWDSYGDEKKAIARWEQLKKLTIEANATNPDIIIWPEASAPLSARRMPDESVHVEPVQELSQSLGTPMIIGTDEAVVEIREGHMFRRATRNSCFSLDANGEISAAYSKRHLVMFGEYVPFEKWFPFLKKLAPVGTFTPGEGPKVFDLGKAKAAPIICFEDVVFPMVRKTATDEVDFLDQSHQ